MDTSHKVKSLAAAAAACVGLLAAAPANALVYAVSHLNVQDFTLSIAGPGVSTSLSSYTFDMTNSSSLNGVTSAGGTRQLSCGSIATPCGLGPVLNPTQAHVGAPAHLADDFTMYSPPSATDSYSRADGILTTAELVNGIPTSFEMIAESLLNINGQAAANSDVQSATNLGISFAVAGGPASLVLSFEADPDQQVMINDVLGAYSSQANMNASFTLTQESTGDTISWSPLGSGANNCISSIAGATCVEDDDTERLNGPISTGVNPNTVNRSFDLANTFSLFGITIDGLVAGDYSIALNAAVSTSIRRQAVPEPGALALVGLALAGLAFTGQRRKRV